MGGTDGPEPGDGVLHLPKPDFVRDGIARYREALAEAGHDPASREVLGVIQMYCADSNEEAAGQGWAYTQNYLRFFADLDTRNPHDSTAYEAYRRRGGAKTMGDLTYERFDRSNLSLIGDVERVHRQAALGPGLLRARRPAAGGGAGRHASRTGDPGLRALRPSRDAAVPLTARRPQRPGHARRRARFRSVEFARVRDGAADGRPSPLVQALNERLHGGIGVAAVLAATICWSTAGVIAFKSGTRGLPLTFWRVLIVAALFGVAMVGTAPASSPGG